MSKLLVLVFGITSYFGERVAFPQVENHEIPRQEAEEVFDECWEDTFDVDGKSIAEKVEPLGDVKHIFETLKCELISGLHCISDDVNIASFPENIP